MRDSRHCPACSGELPVKELFRKGSDVRAIFFPLGFSTGIECPTCNAKLVASQWRGAVATSMVIALSVVAMLGLRPSIGHDEKLVMSVILVLIVSGLFFTWHLHRWLVRFRPATRALKYPLGSKADWDEARRQAEDEQRQWREIEAEMDAAEARGEYQDLAGPWNCDQCREENPPELKVCWNCGASAPERLLGHLRD